MKKSNLLRAAGVLLILTLLSTSIIGGTFAKYTSSASGSDTATVAKWAFKVGSTNIADSQTFTFNLFETVKDSDGNNEADVATPSKIAPGTSGEFSISLKNESEVTATYAIDYTVTNTYSIPVKYSVDGGTNWTDDLTDVTATDIAMKGGTASITVKWKWDYQSATDSEVAARDASDTALATASTAQTLSVTAAITATQKD